MKNALIFTGGCCNTADIKINPSEYDIIIAADSGYTTAKRLGIMPGLAVGDFDSLNEPLPLGIEVLKVPAEKNETDTMLACTTAIERGATSITVIGGTGGRADHFISNLFFLEFLSDRGISAVLNDGDNELRAVEDGSYRIENNGGYFSVFALDRCVVTLSGCKYPLNNATLTRNYPYAVSNEVVGEYAIAEINGKAILCKSKK